MVSLLSNTHPGKSAARANCWRDDRIEPALSKMNLENATLSNVSNFAHLIRTNRQCRHVPNGDAPRA
jgi:hypothetical protein